MPRPLLRRVAVSAVAAILLVGVAACSGPVAVQTAKPTGFGTIDGQTPSPEDLPSGNPVEGADPQAGFSTLVDDTQHLTVQVPSSWSDVDGSPFTDDSGNVWVAITASPDIDGYYSSWEFPGLDLYATSSASGVSAQAILDTLSAAFKEQCQPAEAGQAYSDSLYEGTFNAYTGCGGSSTEVLVLGAAALDGTHTVGLVIQAVTEDDKTTNAQAILSSFLAAF